MTPQALSRLALAALFLGGAADAAKPKPTKRITILSDPPGAKVYIDGKDDGIACQAGPDCKPSMTRGKHRIILELDGYKTVEENINVVKAQKFNFKLQTAPAAGHIDIKAMASNQNATGGEIYIDGKLSGSVPATVDVQSGKHTIEIKRPGYLPFTSEVELKNGETLPVMVGMNPEPRTTYVAQSTTLPKPPEAPPPPVIVPVASGYPVTIIPRDSSISSTVTMAGQPACVTPCNLHLPSGPSTITVDGPGSKHFSQDVMIPATPSQISYQHFTLSRVIAGPILMVLAIPALAYGGILVKTGLQFSPPDPISVGVGSVLLLHGVAFGISGIIQLATIRPSRAYVTPVGELNANAYPYKPRFKLEGGGIAPTTDRSGAMAGMNFSF